jgi:hypothetical protein
MTEPARVIDPWTHSIWDGHEFRSDEPACGQCKFWERIAEMESGICHRHAPRATSAFDELLAEAMIALAKLQDGGMGLKLPMDVSRDAYWPETQNYEWCGEFVIDRGPRRVMPR